MVDLAKPPLRFFDQFQRIRRTFQKPKPRLDTTVAGLRRETVHIPARNFEKRMFVSKRWISFTVNGVST
jgi:hypothetical protein